MKVIIVFFLKASPTSHFYGLCLTPLLYFSQHFHMYSFFLASHSLFRWLVLLSLIYAIFHAWRGWKREAEFGTTDNRIRHWTATIAHIQLTLGIALYSISPLIKSFFQTFETSVKLRDLRFFGMEHSLMMLIAVIVISIGSAKAKRKTEDRDKFRTMMIWFLIGLLIILINIPWPFSPMAVRPWFRPF